MPIWRASHDDDAEERRQVANTFVCHEAGDRSGIENARGERNEMEEAHFSHLLHARRCQWIHGQMEGWRGWIGEGNGMGAAPER